MDNLVPQILLIMQHKSAEHFIEIV